MKLNKHAWAVWCIALVVVIALMILIPFSRTTAWWIAAGCTVLMFGLCAFTFAWAFRQDGTMESKVLGWPVIRVGYTALIVQIIAGAVLMGIASFCPVWTAAITELIVFAVTGICLAVKDAAREAVTYTETAVTDNTAAWKAIRNRAASIAAATNHPELRKLAEEIRFADPTPTSMDGQIADMLETLSSYADAENIRKALRLMEQRKTLVRAEKSERK